jgi:hypothetical protein
VAAQPIYNAVRIGRGAGWCNRQHACLWSRNLGFESLSRSFYRASFIDPRASVDPASAAAQRDEDRGVRLTSTEIGPPSVARCGAKAPVEVMTLTVTDSEPDDDATRATTEILGLLAGRLTLFGGVHKRCTCASPTAIFLV